ncbi:MAG: carboxypeptidase-like regulatory domain-containing protein [Bacteroidetes bacterium]|nr:carboxypeptidase-like regulatory domain-containing protein [Bacteroidota bacterium]
MTRIFLIIIFALVWDTDLSAQRLIYGTVRDQETKQPLAFATIGLKGLSFGTISNSQGEFTLRIPKNLTDSIIVVSYLGYKSKEIAVSFKDQINVELTPHQIQLDELVIRPLSPTDYIKKAVKKYPDNYPSNPFQTKAYYREKFLENGNVVHISEGVFKSYYPSFQDTLKNQHQLLLFRQADDIYDIAFMNDWIEKKEAKKKKKALKKGKEYEETNITNEIREGFGGPETILGIDLTKNEEPCLDSTLFKKFRYSFANGVSYQERQLLVINFETKGKVDHTRQKGQIFIDIQTDAIVALEYSGVLVVPAFIRPILFVFGLEIENPTFEKKVKYQLVDELWYPENFQWFVNLQIKKKYIFKKNEKSRFYGEQVLKVNQANTTNPMEIPEDKRFDAEKPMNDQQYPDDETTWNNVNALKLEERP